VPTTAQTRKHSVFLRRLFARGKVYEDLFDSICNAGCDAKNLSLLLSAVCTIAGAYRGGFLDPGDISTTQLKRLTRDLLSLADLVERVNHTRLNPKRDILAAPPDADRDPIRKHMAYLYDKLPFIMRVYSFHLGRFSKFSRALLKRLTFVHLETLRLLLYIEESTGRPRYDDISNLLTTGFLVAGGTEDSIPEFFSADALAKLKQRTSKFGLTSRF
jgi:hypothetical protein